MGRVVLSAQRLSVAPYAVARGDFLPVRPLIEPVFSIDGVSNKLLDATWDSLVSQDWALFDPEHADLLWPALSTGRILSCSATAVSEKVYGVRGDRSSQRSYTAVRSEAGGTSTMSTWQGSGMWLVAAMRLTLQAQGVLLNVTTTLGDVTISLSGRAYQFAMNGMVYGTHPRDPSDATVTCLGITVYENRVLIGIREGLNTQTYTYIGSNSDGEPMYPLEMTVGGPGSPDLLTYVIAQGDNDQMTSVMQLLAGYLSC